MIRKWNRFKIAVPRIVSGITVGYHTAYFEASIFCSHTVSTNRQRLRNYVAACKQHEECQIAIMYNIHIMYMKWLLTVVASNSTTARVHVHVLTLHQWTFYTVLGGTIMLQKRYTNRKVFRRSAAVLIYNQQKSNRSPVIGMTRWRHERGRATVFSSLHDRMAVRVSVSQPAWRTGIAEYTHEQPFTAGQHAPST